MQYLLTSILLLLMLSSCEEQKTHADHNAKIEATKVIEKSVAQKALEAKSEKDALLAELKAKNIALEKVRKENQEAQAKLLVQEQAKKEAFLKTQLKKEQAKKEITQNKKLSKVGIHVENHTITIDTNKTKDFFKQLGENFGNKIKKITQELNKDVIDQKEVGIHIDENNINIDFNKTKVFLEKWGKKMQGFVREFDAMAKDMNIKEIENQKMDIK